MKKNSNIIVICILVICCVVILALSVVIIKLLESRDNQGDSIRTEKTEITEEKDDTNDIQEDSNESEMSALEGYWTVKLNGSIHGAYIYSIYCLEILDKGIIGYNWGTDAEAFRVGVEDITVTNENGATAYNFSISQMLIEDGTTGKYFKEDVDVYIYYDESDARLKMMVKDIEDGQFVLLSENVKDN